LVLELDEEVDDLESVDETDVEESVRSALRLSLGDALVSKTWTTK
jgi:hypothetical protein